MIHTTNVNRYKRKWVLHEKKTRNKRYPAENDNTTNVNRYKRKWVLHEKKKTRNKRCPAENDSCRLHVT